MTAGRGISHSEQNLSSDERAHVLQLWIIPSERDLTPSYEHKRFPQLGRNQLVSIASGDGRGESMRIHQDALIEMAWLDEGHQLTKSLSVTRGYWVQVISGLIGLNGTEMREGDGAAIEGETKLVIEADTDADVLVLDLP
jgi:redox-sensitive bicupin YhaK (pirin superfamily)